MSLNTPENTDSAPANYQSTGGFCSLDEGARAWAQGCVPNLEVGPTCSARATFPFRENTGTIRGVMPASGLSWCKVLTGILPKKFPSLRIKAIL